MAEGEGFEPSVRYTHNGFRDRHDRPLCHPSNDGWRVVYKQTNIGGKERFASKSLQQFRMLA